MSISSTTKPFKKLLLFGKTGDGKSTVANMLLNGDVEGEFAAGNSLVAVTEEAKEATNPNLNWTIIDTVGMFATDRPGEDQNRVKQLRNYLASNHPDIDMFCYVKKASRFTKADEQSWKAFNTLLDGVKPFLDNIVLVFTSCNEGPGWVAQYEDVLNQHMQNQWGPASFHKVAVDFPPRSDNPEVETELKDIRTKSLERLKAVVLNSHAVPVHLNSYHEEPGNLPKVLKKFLQGLTHGSPSHDRPDGSHSKLSQHGPM